VTGADLDEGTDHSQNLMEAADIFQYEQIKVYNIMGALILPLWAAVKRHLLNGARLNGRRGI
jgi:hypothetical protein